MRSPSAALRSASVVDSPATRFATASFKTPSLSQRATSGMTVDPVEGSARSAPSESVISLSKAGGAKLLAMIPESTTALIPSAEEGAAATALSSFAELPAGSSRSAIGTRFPASDWRFSGCGKERQSTTVLKALPLAAEITAERVQLSFAAAKAAISFAFSSGLTGSPSLRSDCSTTEPVSILKICPFSRDKRVAVMRVWAFGVSPSSSDASLITGTSMFFACLCWIFQMRPKKWSRSGRTAALAGPCFGPRVSLWITA